MEQVWKTCVHRVMVQRTAKTRNKARKTIYKNTMQENVEETASQLGMYLNRVNNR